MRPFTLIAVLFLFAALLFTGCPMGDEKFVDDHKLNKELIGGWADNSPTAGDSYTITNNTLTYGFGSDFISYAGTIKYVSNFTSTAGVIIIEYDSDHKASYWEYDENWEPVTELPLKGNFIGIYYKNLKPGISVEIGGAYEEGGAEKTTLEAAKEAFTMGNEGSYMKSYGMYTKQ